MVTAAGAQVIADGKEIYHAVIDEEHRKFIVDYMEKIILFTASRQMQELS